MNLTVKKLGHGFFELWTLESPETKKRKKGSLRRSVTVQKRGEKVTVIRGNLLLSTVEIANYLNANS